MVNPKDIEFKASRKCLRKIWNDKVNTNRETKSKVGFGSKIE